MNRQTRYLVISVAVALGAAALVSGALARGGRAGGRGGASLSGNLCLSGVNLTLNVSRIDILISTSGSQKPALDQLKSAAQDYSDSMSRACAGDIPLDLPSKLAASEKRLDTALASIRMLKPAIEKFYGTLNDDQKREASLFIDLPGL